MDIKEAIAIAAEGARIRDSAVEAERKQCVQACRDVAAKFERDAERFVGQRAGDDALCRAEGAEACAEAIWWEVRRG